ncbi:MAG: hypothetical protein V4642_02070 [Bacteroidota bacterium]
MFFKDFFKKLLKRAAELQRSHKTHHYKINGTFVAAGDYYTP